MKPVINKDNFGRHHFTLGECQWLRSSPPLEVINLFLEEIGAPTRVVFPKKEISISRGDCSLSLFPTHSDKCFDEFFEIRIDCIINGNEYITELTFENSYLVKIVCMVDVVERRTIKRTYKCAFNTTGSVNKTFPIYITTGTVGEVFFSPDCGSPLFATYKSTDISDNDYHFEVTYGGNGKKYKTITSVNDHEVCLLSRYDYNGQLRTERVTFDGYDYNGECITYAANGAVKAKHVLIGVPPYHGKEEHQYVDANFKCEDEDIFEMKLCHPESYTVNEVKSMINEPSMKNKSKVDDFLKQSQLPTLVK